MTLPVLVSSASVLHRGLSGERSCETGTKWMEWINSSWLCARVQSRLNKKFAYSNGWTNLGIVVKYGQVIVPVFLTWSWMAQPVYEQTYSLLVSGCLWSLGLIHRYTSRKQPASFPIRNCTPPPTINIFDKNIIRNPNVLMLQISFCIMQQDRCYKVGVIPKILAIFTQTSFYVLFLRTHEKDFNNRRCSSCSVFSKYASRN